MQRSLCLILTYDDGLDELLAKKGLGKPHVASGGDGVCRCRCRTTTIV